MALFGKKAKDAPSGPVSDDSSGGNVAVLDDDAAAAATDASDAPAKVKRAKAARAPKVVKNKTVKNGVAVGLNIGNQFIKAVEVTSKNGELAVTAMGAVPTPPESYTNGNVLSVSALSNAIKDLWRTAGIKSKVAITSVAGTGALVVRVIEVPKMSDGELRDNMKVDADRYIPFPPSEVVMDFKALRDLPSDPDAPNMEVLLAAAQREIIDLHVKVVQTAKLDPRAIDVETIAATRALQLERRGGDGLIDYNEVTGVVNLGATGAEISILRGDMVVFTRVVPNGGNALTQAIAEGLGLPFSDAEHVKIVSADALPPAGYGTAAAGDDFGFGDTGSDFNFGGDEFSGGDFNSAFEDISANPSTAAATDDPFDLDFFNQGPEKDEPGAGHAQKEGEDDPTPPPFSFDFDAPAPAPQPAPKAQPDTSAPAPSAPAPSAPAPSAPAPSAPAPATSGTAPEISFDFGDDLNEDYLPTLAPEAPAEPTATASTEKRTAPLDDFGFDANDTTPLPVVEESIPNPATQTATPTLNEGFSSLIPSAFDFDNFDLPGVQDSGLTTVSTPIEKTPPAPVAATPAPDFTPTTPPPPAPADSRPASFGFDDDDLASTQEQEAPAPAPFDFSLATPAATEAPAVAPVIAPTAPLSVTSAPGEASGEEETEFEAPVVNSTAAQAPVSQSSSDANSSAANDEFDLDSIFGETAPATAPFDEDPFATPATGNATGDAVPAGLAATSDDDFGLGGIESGLGSFAAGFGDQQEDFSAFGAGLVEDGASTDAATLYSLIQPSLEELSNEVRRSLEFHLGRYPDATISRLVLLGGGAKLRNIDVFFTQSLGVPTVVANPFAHIAMKAPKLPPDYATENGPLCTVALGLALRDFVD